MKRRERNVTKGKRLKDKRQEYILLIPFPIQHNLPFGILLFISFSLSDSQDSLKGGKGINI